MENKHFPLMTSSYTSQSSFSPPWSSQFLTINFNQPSSRVAGDIAQAREEQKTILSSSRCLLEGDDL